MIFHVIEGAAEVVVDDTRPPLDEADTACAPGYSRVMLRNRSADQPSFLFIADETPLHQKLGMMGLQTFEKKLHSGASLTPPLPMMASRPRAPTPASAIRRSQVRTNDRSWDMVGLLADSKAAQDACRSRCAEQRGDQVADVEGAAQEVVLKGEFDLALAETVPQCIDQ